MSVHPTFDQPNSRLIVSLSYLSDPDKTSPATKTAETHPFNHSAKVLLPLTSNSNQTTRTRWEKGFHQHGQASKFHKVSLPLRFFLDTTFQQHVRRGGTMALQCNVRIDQDDVFALLPSGTLLLNVTKPTYEKLGLVGKPSQLSPKGERYQISVDISAPSFKPTNKLYERVKWCFEHTLPNTYDFYMSSIDSSTGALRDIPFPPDANAKTISNPFTSHTEENVLIPPMSNLPLSFSSGIDGAEDQETVLERLEWIGMVACGADRIRATDKVDPFISVYSTPEASTPGDVFIGTWTGFIPAKQILDLITGLRDLIKQDSLPWAALLVSGFRDSPISWRQSEHGYASNGENDYVLLVLPDGRCVVFQALGSEDTFAI
ncbi:Ribonuclease P protein subunit p40 [Rhizophlyctis rosea]|uniref:Ribonuclease P protein subunit p40 n=1 Tax=Rhizophlyctis rosea TaxID=64517 RepID=A0AAD5X117_9FUNG|nr:Ribonuclease P protein subunit p40 [Rhizophlyctis rosea]